MYLYKLIAMDAKEAFSRETLQHVPGNTPQNDDPGDSDEEEMPPLSTIFSEMSLGPIPRLEGPNASVKPEHTTAAAGDGQRRFPVKGNQLVLWCFQAVSVALDRLIPEADRREKIAQAIAAKRVTISRASDWLLYEGMFDAFRTNLSWSSLGTFFGTAVIDIGFDRKTEVEFKFKTNRKLELGRWVSVPTTLLYAHVKDPILINYLSKRLGFKKYQYENSRGLSYKDLIDVIEKIKRHSVVTDKNLATRQLELLNGSLQTKRSDDYFLAYFNAILFGSEPSRIRSSFVTGLMVLELISDGKLSYKDAFLPPDRGSADKLAVYPMASTFTGPGNFKGYETLLVQTYQERSAQFDNPEFTENGQVKVSSEIGMRFQREYSTWAQIPLKEAVLIKYWLQSYLLPPPSRKRDHHHPYEIQHTLQNIISMRLEQGFNVLWLARYYYIASQEICILPITLRPEMGLAELLKPPTILLEDSFPFGVFPTISRPVQESDLIE